jgi:hypothetical protein
VRGLREGQRIEPLRLNAAALEALGEPPTQQLYTWDLRREPRPIGEMADLPQTIHIAAGMVAGEQMANALAEIPLGRGVDLEALKAGDDDPLEVVVELSAGASKRGWHYTREALAKIAGEVNEGGLPGYLGHQKPEDVSHKFEAPVTHWVGAKEVKPGTFRFRGVIDQAAKDLKRWIKSRRITQTSIFGVPTLKRAGGETVVTDYEPISIDWTPLKRAGMQSAIVALGEIDSITNPGAPAPSIDPQKEEGMTLEELLAEARKLNVQPGQIIGEMSWKQEDVLKALEIELQPGEDAIKVVGELATVFGTDKSEEIVAQAKAGKDALDAQATEGHTKLVNKVIEAKVAGEMAQELVRDMIRVDATASEADIEKAVGECLDKPHVKAALKQAKGEIRVGGSSDNSNSNGNTGSPVGLAPRKVRI